MKFEDIILEEMFSEDESIEINEDIFPITPFLAYASFKKSTFGALRDKMYDVKANVGNWGTRKKAKMLIGREKLRAGVGVKSGRGDDATVYKLTSTQMNVMADIYKKHGNKIIKDIMEFRKNVLAPYSLIKRKIKEATRVTNKDKFGMTKAEFKAYLESGRRKIENRGEKFLEKSEELRNRLDRITEQIKTLEEAEKKLGEAKEFPRSILNRIYKNYNIHDKDLLGYSPEELRQVQSKMDSEAKEIISLIDKFKEGSASKEDVFRAADLGTRKPIKIKKGEDEREVEVNADGNFNIALGRYLFRDEVLTSLKDADENAFKGLYRKIVTEMIEALNENRRNTIRKLSSLNSSTKLTEKEALIWKKRSTASKDSADLNDFYQAIREEDFLDTPIYLERTPELKKAEQEIENEIKRFERSLEKKIGKQDFQKLKQHRLINNLITVRELKASGDLFKDTNELLQTTGSTQKDLEKSEKYISPSDFERRVWSMHGYTFSSVSELNAAKKELEDLIEKIKAQGDEQSVNKLSNVIERLRIRRTLQPQRTSYVGQASGFEISIDEIEKKAEEIANKQYDSSTEARRDKERLDDMIRKFRDSEGDQAEAKLNRIKFLLDKVDRRMAW